MELAANRLPWHAERRVYLSTIPAVARAVGVRYRLPGSYGRRAERLDEVCLPVWPVTDPLDISQRKYLDTESRGILYQGASVNQLAALFHMKTPDVMRRLGDLQPVGMGRQGNPIYSVAQAASRLCKLEITETELLNHIRRMDPKALPPLLNKLFWEGMSARIKYRGTVGELWHTTDVLAVAATAFQSLRMSILLIPDTLMNETELSEAQLKIAQDTVDRALEDAREQLIRDLQQRVSGSEEESDEL